VKNSINLSVLKSHLKMRSQEQLIDEISDLFKRFSEVKDYYQVKIYPEANTEIIGKYKEIIENEFFPSRGIGNCRLSVAKKAIADYKKVCDRAENLIDIMLFYVEQGVKYTKTYGDIDAPFYTSLESMYAKAIENIVKFSMKANFQNRCHKVVEQTADLGWGFGDMIKEIYDESF
jgi:hypothetical protein